MNHYSIVYYFIATISVLCVYGVLDALWLGVIAKSSYQHAMQGMLRERFLLLPCVLFYCIYALAMAHLVVVPHINTTSVVPVAVSGFVLGLASYGAYNLTNYAVLNGWPLSITIKDLAWGSVAGALASAGAWYVTRTVLL
jgi:uncharacterized membrane protein